MFRIGPIPFEIDKNNRKILLFGNEVNCNYDAVIDIIYNNRGIEHRNDKYYKLDSIPYDLEERLVYDKRSNSILIHLYAVSIETTLFKPNMDREYRVYHGDYSGCILTYPSIINFYEIYDVYTLIITNTASIIFGLYEDKALVGKWWRYCDNNQLKSLIPKFGETWSYEHNEKVVDFVLSSLSDIKSEYADYIRDNIRDINYDIGLLVNDNDIALAVSVRDKTIKFGVNGVEICLTNKEFRSNIIDIKTASIVEVNLKREKPKSFSETIIKVTDEEVTIDGKKASEKVERAIRLLLK